MKTELLSTDFMAAVVERLGSIIGVDVVESRAEILYTVDVTLSKSIVDSGVAEDVRYEVYGAEWDLRREFEGKLLSVRIGAEEERSGEAQQEEAPGR